MVTPALPHAVGTSTSEVCKDLGGLIGRPPFDRAMRPMGEMHGLTAGWTTQ